ncbi:MAG: inositol monophosphatase [Reichenbachiella sp.]
MMLSDDQLEELKDVAILAAQTTNDYIYSKLGQVKNVGRKEAGDSLASQVVTEIDIESQNIILAHLKASIELYDLGLLTEELEDDGSRLDKNYFWCIDPLDGTLPFSEGRTGYAVSIALVHRSGHAVIGVVAIPDTGELYYAISGQGLFLNGKSLKINTNKASKLHVYLDHSFVVMPYYDAVIDALKSVQDDPLKLIIGQGSVVNAIRVLNEPNACYFKFPKVEIGGGSIWDFAATSCIFNEAGLNATDIQGNPLMLNDPKSTFFNRWGAIYARNKKIHSDIISIGNKFQSEYESLK